MNDLYIERTLEQKVMTGLRRSPVVALVGPRQCGKSTLAKRLQSRIPGSLHLDLENPRDLAKLDDPAFFLGRNRGGLVCIDEVQRKPELFPVLRYLCDEWGGNGHFLVLGSASRDLLRQSSETLAGRIEYLRLTPFLLDETGDEPWERYLFRGGFPRAWLAKSDEDARAWLDSFVMTFLERDLSFWREFVPEAMRRLWRMLAHDNGQTVNFTRLASALGVSDATVRRYVDLLSETFMADIVPPFAANLKKRLVKSPKVYLADTGITCALLGIASFDDAFSHPGYGALWEQLVLTNIRGHFQNADVSFFRTADGAEIDFVVSQSGRTVAVECKTSSAPTVGKGTHIALDDIAPDAAFLIAPVPEPYPLDRRITVINPGHIDRLFDHQPLTILRKTGRGRSVSSSGAGATRRG